MITLPEHMRLGLSTRLLLNTQGHHPPISSKLSSPKTLVTVTDVTSDAGHGYPSGTPDATLRQGLST